MSIKRVLILTTVLLPLRVWADTTNTQTIARVLYDGVADYLYVVAPTTWGSPACPNALYVQISPAVAGRKQIMAAVLAAKAAGQQVRFQGACNSNPNYFDANYIDVQ